MVSINTDNLLLGVYSYRANQITGSIWVKMNRDVGQVVKSLLRYVIFWVDLTWKYLKAASMVLKNFTWLLYHCNKDFQKQMGSIWTKVVYGLLWKMPSSNGVLECYF